MTDNNLPNLLLVESDAETGTQMADVLQQHFGLRSVTRCNSLADALTVDLTRIDIALTELDLSDGSGLDLLRLLLDCKPELPVIIVTNQRRAEHALQAIRMGASDYLVKAGDYLFALPVIVEKTLVVWRTKQENVRLQAQLASTLTALRMKNRQLEEAVKKLETMAATDPLTGLANRRSFNQFLERAFAEASRYGHDLAAIMIDLDGFKLCNDKLGHQKGDEVLQRTARVLEANCRRSDVAGRLGGDEFVVLLPQTGLDRAQTVAQRIGEEMSFCTADLRQQLAAHLPEGLGLSMGVATLRHSRPATADELIAQADQALYRAKSAGKGRHLIFDAPPRNAPAATRA